MKENVSLGRISYNSWPQGFPPASPPASGVVCSWRQADGVDGPLILSGRTAIPVSQMQHRRNMSDAFQMDIPGEQCLNSWTRERDSKRKYLSPIAVGSLEKRRVDHPLRLSSQAWSHIFGDRGVSDLDWVISFISSSAYSIGTPSKSP